MAAEVVPSRWQALRQAEAMARSGASLAREQRAPTAATQSTRWLGKDQPQIPEWDADTALRLGYMANVIAYRCIQIRAEVLSSFPLRWGAEKPERPGEQADHDPTCAGARLLGPPRVIDGRPAGPNPETSARNLLRWTAVQRIATGRNAWEVEYAGAVARSNVVGLWPLPAPSLRAVPTESGDRYWKRFIYKPDLPDRKELRPEQVVYGWAPSGHDWREPEAALSATRYPLAIAVMGDRYSHAFLKNGAVPATVVITEQFDSVEEKDRFRAQWEGQYQGPDNAGKTAFYEAPPDGDGPVEETIAVKQLGLSQRDARFLEQHKAVLQEVAIGLGVPWSRLDASGRTFDNAAQEDRSFLLQTILPDLQDFEDEINMQLAPRLGGEVCWFDLSGVEALRPAPRWGVVEGVSLLDRGALTVNEQRAEMGLPPVEGGDVGGGAGDVPEPVEEPGSGEEAASDRGGGPGPVEGSGSLRATTADGGDSRIPPSPATTRDPTPAPESRAKDRSEARRLLWAATEPMLAGLERSWERAFRSLFARQAKAVKGRLEGGARGKRLSRAAAERRALTQQEIVDLFDPAFWAVETREVAEGLYEVVVATSVGRIAGTLEGVSFDLSAPWVQEFIQARSNQLAGQVTETTYRAVTSALAEGVGAGEGVPQLAARVGHVFDVARGSRATTIARTEVISAYNGAAVAGASALPSDVVGGQEWIATGDAKTRPEHLSADGQVVAVGEPFNVGGESLAYPGDPSGSAATTVNCRCTVGFLTPAEMAEGMGLGPGAGAHGPRVTLGAARSALRLVIAETFDAERFRSALLEAA